MYMNYIQRIHLYVHEQRVQWVVHLCWHWSALSPHILVHLPGCPWGRKTAISYGFRTMWVWHWPDAGQETKGFTSCIMLPCHQKSTFSLHSCDIMSWHGQTTKEKNRSWQTAHRVNPLEKESNNCRWQVTFKGASFPQPWPGTRWRAREHYLG